MKVPQTIKRFLMLVLLTVATLRAAESPDVAAMREEIRAKGWIAFSARSPKGDYDLFLMRPDGSSLTNITRTADFNEAYPLFSRDGSQLLCRRLARGETVSGNDYGTQGALVIARADGTDAKAFGSDGKTPQLVYAENGRHTYGGHISPDGQYVIFTGNMQEDGDPKNAGAPMSLMRLRDAPIIVGVSENVRAKFPHAKSGPVLSLPAGWEPCWTTAEVKFQ